MKRFKKVFAVILSLAMVLGMSLTSFAAPVVSNGDGKVPSDENKATATASNIEAGAVVTAYRIVKPSYTSNGITGYEATTEAVKAILVDAEKKEAPTIVTSAQITEIANLDLTQFSDVVVMKGGDPDTNGLTTYTAELPAGYWMVIVSKGSTQYNKVYNPMLLGVYYSKSGSNSQLTMGPVDAAENWTLETENAFAKSSEPTLQKFIVEDGEEVKGNDVAFVGDNYGDVVNFRIKTQIPSYSDDYEDVMVKIADTLDPGLTLDMNSITVSVGGTDVTNDKVAYTAHDVTVAGFTIDFFSDYAKLNGNKEVIVEYSATINKDANINYDFNKNTATLDYTNNPSNVEDAKHLEDQTYTYTFAIDSDITGKYDEEWKKLTEEIVKTGDKKVIDLGGGQSTVTTRLEGAEFTLTRTDKKRPDGTDYVYTKVTDENGYLKFRGLDAGTYTLVETKAPEGYSLNNTPATVVITSDIDETTGLLNSYTITINGEKTSTYKATYEGETITKIEYVNGGTQLDKPDENHQTTGASDIFEIKNTKLAALPSTGGIGTTIFTIGGCAIMIIAAALFFASRRKTAK